MLIRSIKLNNFLSYGDSAPCIPLNSLNVIIGPNGSGKSNLIEAIELLRATPKDLLTPIRDGGGIRDWLWKGSSIIPTASIEAVFSLTDTPSNNLRYTLGFTEVAQRFEITDERLETETPKPHKNQPYLYYEFRNGHGVLNVKGRERRLQHEEIELNQSILSQRKDPDQYPELTRLGRSLAEIKLYREWSFGRYTTPRIPQKADLPNEWLEADARNLGLVLNRLRREPQAKQRLLSALQALYEGIDDYDIQIEGGTVQVFFHEGRFTVPATRLSDGTLRYLCLLAILCHPNPPPLVCIEEPELGLHPDILPTLADLLKEASERCQLIVTTHSEILVDALSDQPESVLVAEKNEAGSTLTRLDAEQLKPWLEKYRLGQLWTQGQIGGTRW
ncbi:AAA family ATPase [Methylomonas sp. SURF-2]|uniref:AAA family ATPase n=1 Tax=Methylomonas subterranea TaxID=2952225 RepID=A0ABT1TAS0_9GAMM|nr:AAA family ATPase [Methylomonas sp. SURF-2]MCQ8102565.1 AAA family ATPase [Methylomonas sp. SURF-2]